MGGLSLLPDEHSLSMAGKVSLHLPPGIQHQLPLPITEPHGSF